MTNPLPNPLPNPLIEITEASHDVLLDLVYATERNFTGKAVYGRAVCYLHPEAEKRLLRAVTLAKALELRIKIFDAFRPSEAQWILWGHTPDPDFLADPRRGSPHSRGAALDLTLVNGDGAALEMGAPFDAFTPMSHHGATEIANQAQRNRYLLLGLMSSAGWAFYGKEWWHYQLFNSRDYPLLSDADLPESMMSG